jgi:Fe-S oxidoreductase
VDRYGYISSLYGHFGQGCVHTRTDFDFSSAHGIARFRAFIEECADLVLSYGGSLSGEHGDGQARGELLPRMFGEELMTAFREFKNIWDPEGMMNPGVLVESRPLDADLRLADRPPTPARTHFSFRRDGGDFTAATIRCVGVGRCRRHDAGTMCPSYMVTREEKHSTRGRARLLHEMLRGDPLTDGWRDESVREALDLCLACKGCKHECPTQVDMATYKAEFLSHYYEGRLRPRSAYAMGLIDRWARLAAHIPSLVNAAARIPLLHHVLAAAAGIDPRRDFPAFAQETFTGWWRRRTEGTHAGSRILLWPDTFTQYFNPEIGRAAVRVLEAAGYAVALPPSIRCCGRPLYDFGFLDRARSYLLQILADLAPEIDASTRIVVLEPSCLAVFRDEMVDLLPDDVRAQRLAQQTMSLGEALLAAGHSPEGLSGQALVHGHCHQTAVVGMGPEMTLLTRAGVDATLLDSGCCGMAGAFGFERGHYDVSVACAERVLLPAVRSAGDEVLLIADGFSCREQIRQLSGRRALHLAEALAPE